MKTIREARLALTLQKIINCTVIVLDLSFDYYIINTSEKTRGIQKACDMKHVQNFVIKQDRLQCTVRVT